MPLKLAVGVNRKVGLANYSSAGANLNLELEVDTSLLERPEELQDKIKMLYKMTDAAVREEIARQLANADASDGHGQQPAQAKAGDGHPPAAGGQGANGNNGQARITPKQIDLVRRLAGERLGGGPARGRATSFL